MTIDDQHKPKQFCIEHLRRFFAPSLQPCIIQVNPDENTN